MAKAFRSNICHLDVVSRHAPGCSCSPRFPHLPNHCHTQTTAQAPSSFPPPPNPPLLSLRSPMYLASPPPCMVSTPASPSPVSMTPSQGGPPSSPRPSATASTTSSPSMPPSPSTCIVFLKVALPIPRPTPCSSTSAANPAT